MKLKKYKGLWLALLVAVLALTACNNDDADEINDDEVAQYENGDDADNDGLVGAFECDEVDTEATIGFLGFPLIHLTDEAREIALSDFDYLATFMLENAPQQGIYARRFGTTLEADLLEMQQRIYCQEPVQAFHFLLMLEDDADFPEDPSDIPIPSPDQPRELAAEYLSSMLLWYAVFEIEQLGHFGPQPLEMYRELLEANSAMLHQMEEVDGMYVLNGEEFADIRGLTHFVDILSSESTLWFFGVELDEIDLYRDMDDIGFRVEDNVTTEILEEGRIAYMHIASFINNPGFDSEVFFPFFEEVQDFEHLIIDLRGNGGGWPFYFSDYVVAMLIDEPIEARFFEFLTDGAGARQMADFSLLGSAKGIASEDGLFSAAALVAEHDFPYFNTDDLDLLQYVIEWEFEIEPDEENIPFAGEIWILVDGGSASASELAAQIAMGSGFATVVGEPTAGITAALATHVSLPQTGILFRVDVGYLIDDYGRSLEEHGVTPEILINPGQDALEVVLDLIQ